MWDMWPLLVLAAIVVGYFTWAGLYVRRVRRNPIPGSLYVDYDDERGWDI